MSQLSAPTTSQKRSQSSQSQDSSRVAKKPKESSMDDQEISMDDQEISMDNQQSSMDDYIHRESDKQMKANEAFIVGYTTTIVIRELWNTVVNAEERRIGQSSYEYVWNGLKQYGYLKQPGLQNLINECIASGTWTKLREHSLSFYRSCQVLKPRKSAAVSAAEATERSWELPFIGDACQTLKNIILYHVNSPTKYYANAIPIVQSSGTGKSRLCDQLAKEMLVIPINLRLGGSGFPPPDTNVGTYLSMGGFKSQVLREYHMFLSALFKKTRMCLEKFSCPNESLAKEFHDFMVAGASYSGQGTPRMRFYQDVLDMALETYMAEKTRNTIGDIAREIALDEAKALANFAESKGYGAVVLSLDEVQGLLEVRVGETGERTNGFHCLRRALSYISSEKRVVSLFLSTAGQVHAPPTYLDPSFHVQNEKLFLLPPFPEVGFDQLAVGLVREDDKLLKDMVTHEWMCKFGRPLFGTRYEAGSDYERVGIVDFAATKLLCGIDVDANKELSTSAKIAIMATRLSLCFNRTSLQSQEDELEQVQCHMRFCLSIDVGNETAFTIAPSEPILAEGASYIITRKTIKQARLLKDVLSGPSLDKGDRSGMVARLLFLLARDAVVKGAAVRDATGGRNIKLNAFLKALVRSNDLHATSEESEDCRNQFPNVLHGLPSHLEKQEDDVTLEKCFEHAEMHFNHFIRIENASAMKTDFLHMLIARGAAILCPVNQPGVDVVIPFVLDARKKVGPKNVSAILCQVRNRIATTTEFHEYLFDPGMDPFEYLYKDKSAPVPLIRMVLALNSPDPGVAVLPRRRGNLPQAGASYSEDRYTAYDIWCARACSSTFGVILSHEDGIYEDMLLADGPSEIYETTLEDEDIQDPIRILRKMGNPGANAEDPDHCRFGVL